MPDGGNRTALDVYLPVEGEGPFPTILAFHGGGFKTRSKSLYRPLARHFTDQGYALVAANYRFTMGGVQYPAQVEDAFCALGWIHENAANYGFDTEQVFVMGDSAGGYLAAMVGTVETPEFYRGECPHEVPKANPIRGTVVWYGIYDLVSLEGLSSRDQSLLKALMGAPHSEVSNDLLAEMSPKSRIDGSEPPFLIIHGTQDRGIASWLAEDFAKALEQAGAEATLVLLEDMHGFILQPLSSPTMTAAMEAIDIFLGNLSSP
jgi:acetyl esterase/lipase